MLTDRRCLVGVQSESNALDLQRLLLPYAGKTIFVGLVCIAGVDFTTLRMQ